MTDERDQLSARLGAVEQARAEAQQQLDRAEAEAAARDQALLVSKSQVQWRVLRVIGCWQAGRSLPP